LYYRYLISIEYVFCSLSKSWRQDFEVRVKVYAGELNLILKITL